MKQFYEIDAQGYYVKPVVLKSKLNESLEHIYDVPSNCVEIIPPDSLYKAKWSGAEWIEGATQEEIDEIINVPREPTLEEKFAQLEQENKLLKAQNTALVEQTDFHEEVLTEIILAINS